MRNAAEKMVREEAEEEEGEKQSIFLQRWQRTSKLDMSNLLG